MVENVKIRMADTRDYYDICKIRVETWKVAYKNIISDKILNSLDADTDNSRKKDRFEVTKNGFCVAEINGNVIGFSVFNPIREESKVPNYEIDGEISGIYIYPQFHKNGIGRMFFNFINQKFKATNIKSYIVWCLEKNYAARTFYEKMGGKVIYTKNILIKETEEYPEVGYLFRLN